MGEYINTSKNRLFQFLVSENRFSADFSLVGSGESHSNCGLVFAVGCLNAVEHKGITLDGVDFTGRAAVKFVKNSCKRPICPKCWSVWANRECDNAVHRLNTYVLKKRNGQLVKPIHVIVSLPKADYGLTLPIMRKKTYRALKKVGLFGGMLIYHPRRKANGAWYYSPHFHVVGYGWIRDVRRNYVHSGYVVKNVGIRKNLRGTIYYQLSHCGVSEKFHTVTWFGALAYSKLHVVKIVEKPNVCPICGQKLRRLVWIGEGDNTLALMHLECESGFYFDDWVNWAYKPKRTWDYDD